MADSGSIGFGFRLLHLSLFTFLYVSAAVLIAMQPAQVLATFFVREAAAQLRTDPLCACVLRLLGGFSAFATGRWDTRQGGYSGVLLHSNDTAHTGPLLVYAHKEGWLRLRSSTTTSESLQIRYTSKSWATVER